MSLYFALYTVENNKNKKSLEFQGDMLNFCDFIQVFVFTTNHHLNLYIACNDRNAFFTSDAVRNYNLWSCQKVCEALTFLLDNIYVRFDSKLYRQIVGIPMGTNCAPLVADLSLFCDERDFMLSFQRITNLVLLKLSILLLGIWMTY